MSLLDWQTQFSQALLLPDAPSLGKLSTLRGLEKHRIALYEELLFNTVLDTLQNIYPYTYRLLSRNGEDEEIWQALAEQYRRAYPNQSYKLMGAVCHFPDFLAGQADWMERYPYLKDLAFYEWLEMVVLNLPNHQETTDLPAALPELDEWEHYAPSWNRARQIHAFDFHVPEILECFNRESETTEEAVSVAGLSVDAKPVDILIYRDPHTLEARFFCLNALTAQLIQQASQPGISYQGAIEQLQQAMPALQAMPLPIILQQANGLFEMCLLNGMLLGSTRQ